MNLLRQPAVGFSILALLVLLLTLPAVAMNYSQIDALIESKDVDSIEHAIALLEEHLDKQADDGEALWLASKAYLYLGDRTEEGRLAVFEKGKEYADRAVEVVPDSPTPTTGSPPSWAGLARPGAL